MESGYYRVLKNDLPAAQYWTCGDGCCAEWETYDRSVWYQLGQIILVDDERLGPDTYTVGSDYEGHREEYYRPLEHLDYVSEGYLEKVDHPPYQIRG
jgi:hypothetical protein